ncbi:zinc finger HIT domain-containing protein 2-like [Daphnia carinata]|uniref:zinc finger HIT domain-containing protein 2-like n=1 Tax=Daphnia carinata TaxID=120202 RepID=UPI002868DCBF|nr:zinc finger HIT domain-containing protein 2-like [Daphnia carinata]
MDKITLTSDCVISCELCKEQKAKYTCPRCGIQYCSVMCYKSFQHTQCSEYFFKECVLKELIGSNMESQLGQNQKTNMENLMKKDSMNYAEDLDSDDSEDSYDDNFISRMKNVDLNDSDAVWSLLNEKERTEFQRKLFTGEIVQLLPSWNPWWIQKPNIPTKENDVPEPMEIPPIKTTIPLLSSMMHKKPNGKVVNGLGNILYGYACASRLYMQDWTGSIRFVIETLLAASTILYTNQCFETAQEAITCAQFSAQKLLDISDELNLLVRNDLEQILKSRKFLLAALSDISALLHKGADTKCAPVKRLHIAIKKVDFYLSLVNEYDLTLSKCNVEC